MSGCKKEQEKRSARGHVTIQGDPKPPKLEELESVIAEICSMLVALDPAASKLDKIGFTASAQKLKFAASDIKSELSILESAAYVFSYEKGLKRKARE